MSELTVNESFDISAKIRSERSFRVSLVRYYWSLCFILTRNFDKFLNINVRKLQDSKVMNYGCGNRFYEHAINVDLFAPHRFILGKRRPDLYWSGTVPMPQISGCLEGIVCEHVIEHILPDEVLVLLKSFCSTLQNTGVLVISFPDATKVLSGGLCQGYTTTAAMFNSLIYRHGHCFMYNTDLVIVLLKAAGFKSVQISDYDDLPLQSYIDPARTGESSYVVAKCSPDM